MGKSRTTTLAILAAAVAWSVVPAHAGQPRLPKSEQRALELFDRASQRAYRPARCQPHEPATTLTHDAPSPELLATLAILRRPATAEDSSGQAQLEHLPAHDVYADYVRVAHGADGTSFTIIAARDALPFKPPPAACLRRLHRILRQSLRGEPGSVRRRALSFYRQTVASERQAARRGPQEGVFLFERDPHGWGGGGGGGVRSIRAGEMWFAAGRSERSAHVSALVPDGVASVTTTFGRKHHAAPGEHGGGDYRSVITRTDAVQDNVLSFTVARAPEDAFPRKVIWSDANGAIVRVIHRL